MNTHVVQRFRASPESLPRLALCLTILAWAGFWSWFVVVVALDDARTLGPSSYGYMLGFLGLLWLPSLLAWWRTLPGALAMTAVGVGTMIFLDDPSARALFAGPPLAFGLALAWLGLRERKRARELR